MLAHITRRAMKTLVLASVFSGGHAAPAQATGEQVFMTRCSICHQTSGAGVPGQFPPINGRAGVIAGSAEGRSYLIKLMLFGMIGPIEVDNVSYRGVMPSVGSLSDESIADMLNFIVGLENPVNPATAFTAAEVGAVRAEGKMSGSDVGELRAQLVERGLIP